MLGFFGRRKFVWVLIGDASMTRKNRLGVGGSQSSSSDDLPAESAAGETSLQRLRWWLGIRCFFWWLGGSLVSTLSNFFRCNLLFLVGKTVFSGGGVGKKSCGKTAGFVRVVTIKSSPVYMKDMFIPYLPSHKRYLAFHLHAGRPVHMHNFCGNLRVPTRGNATSLALWKDY